MELVISSVSFHAGPAGSSPISRLRRITTVSYTHLDVYKRQHATWGMWIAFDEPRTRMSLQIIGVGAIVILVRTLLNDDRLSALANLLLGGAVLLLELRTGVLRHPLNPIGDSSSGAIQGFYLAIVATCFGLLFLLAWLLTQRKAPSQGKSEA